MKKRVLFITRFFPPENNGAIGRVKSIYNYLPENGYEIDVITIINKNENLIENRNVHRIDSFVDWKEKDTGIKKKILKIINWILNRFGYPIVDLLWISSALKKTEELIQKNKYNIVFATFPSIDSLELGYRIKLTYKLPLVIEFRDGLVFEGLISRNWLKNSIIKRFEKKIVNNSATIITIGKVLSKYFIDTYHHMNIFTVYNGFDPEDFSEINTKMIKNKIDSKTRIVHFGNLNNSRKGNREPLFKALKKLKEENLIYSTNFELTFFAKFDEENKYIDEYKINDIVTVNLPINKKEGFKYIVKKCNYLLFYGVESTKSVISAKLLEYLNLKIPILGICKGNEAEEIIKMTKTGEVCDFDEHSIYTLLKKALLDGVNYNPNIKIIEKFDRKKQTKQIANILNLI